MPAGAFCQHLWAARHVRYLTLLLPHRLIHKLSGLPWPARLDMCVFTSQPCWCRWRACENALVSVGHLDEPYPRHPWASALVGSLCDCGCVGSSYSERPLQQRIGGASVGSGVTARLRVSCTGRRSTQAVSICNDGWALFAPGIRWCWRWQWPGRQPRGTICSGRRSTRWSPRCWPRACPGAAAGCPPRSWQSWRRPRARRHP